MADLRLANLRNGGRCDIRIDRRSRYGNPFKIGADGHRAQVIAKHRDWLRAHTYLVDTLRVEIGDLNKSVVTLGCWCWPLACHGQNYIDALREQSDGD